MQARISRRAEQGQELEIPLRHGRVDAPAPAAGLLEVRLEGVVCAVAALCFCLYAPPAVREKELERHRGPEGRGYIVCEAQGAGARVGRGDRLPPRLHEQGVAEQVNRDVVGRGLVSCAQAHSGVGRQEFLPGGGKRCDLVR